MARRYVFTAKRRAALRKAQLASARARKRTRKRTRTMSRRKKAAIGVGVLSAATVSAVAGLRVTPIGRNWRGHYQTGKLIQSYENADPRPGARKMSNLEVYSYARYEWWHNSSFYRKRKLKKSVRKTIRGL